LLPLIVTRPFIPETVAVNEPPSSTDALLLLIGIDSAFETSATLKANIKIIIDKIIYLFIFYFMIFIKNIIYSFL